MAMKSLVPRSYIFAAAGFYPLAIVLYLCTAQIIWHQPAQSQALPLDALLAPANSLPTPTVSARINAPVNSSPQKFPG
ncbi:MAG: hypothetical protein JWR16_1454 [Nevskia sp.]|nr:hypothetical protein [Nevskia sp.]